MSPGGTMLVWMAVGIGFAVLFVVYLAATDKSA
jgi:hypothetical protein